MTSDNIQNSARAERLQYWLLVALLIVLFVAGGASRADASGQVSVRLASWSCLIAYMLFGGILGWRRFGAVGAIIAGCGVLVAAQLVPLPPSVWSALPGRALFVEAAAATGQAQPWRPLSVSPGATLNALNSLIVPATVFILCHSTPRVDCWRLMTLVLGLVFTGSMIGLVQLTGTQFDNPLINEIDGAVSGNMSDRNHFGLFLAMGVLAVPSWACAADKRVGLRLVLGAALMVFFLLTILATGSRMGLLLGALSLLIGIATAWRKLVRLAGNISRRAVTAVGIIGFAVTALLLLLAVSGGRAQAIDRLFALRAGEDLRAQALPTVLAMIRAYFPVGTGFGTFDPAYRIWEVDALLSPSYFNHAHSDWLEVVLDGGLAAAILLLLAIAWYVKAAAKIWLSKASGNALGKIATGWVLLILLASVSDYPARTPLMMALLVLAGVWISATHHNEAGLRGKAAALPAGAREL